MTKSEHMACGTRRRMNGYVKSMRFQQYPETAATLLSLLLIMVVDSTKTVSAGRTQQCGNALLQTLKLTKLAQKESVEIIKTYKASQGDLSELLCKGASTDLPNPNISGLETPEQISSIHTRLQEFVPHFKRVYEQQTDLQLPDSSLLKQLTLISTRNQYLDAQINILYQSLFPNSTPLVPSQTGGTTSLPPPLNTFQQKVYGCMVLKTYKEFLSNVSKILRTLRNQMCGMNKKRRSRRRYF